MLLSSLVCKEARFQQGNPEGKLGSVCTALVALLMQSSSYETVEIKSTNCGTASDTGHFSALSRLIPSDKLVCVCRSLKLEVAFTANHKYYTVELPAQSLLLQIFFNSVLSTLPPSEL